jgi:pectate lyase
MEKYAVRNVEVVINGKKVALFPEAVFVIELDKIKVMIDEAILSSDTMGFFSLIGDKEAKEFIIKGKVNDKTLVIEKARIYNFGLTAKAGETVILKNIRILGLTAKWES